MPGFGQAFLYKYSIKLLEHTTEMPTKSFRDFLSGTDYSPKLKSKSKSIEYLENLDISDFIDTIENISKLIASEKLDGTALTFGFDNDGKFYTTRSGKGNQDAMHYKASEWGISAAANGFKAAHAALKNHQDTLSHFIKPGMACDIEILFGHQPNTIVYGLDGINYIAFVRITQGTDKKLEIDQEVLKKMAKACRNLTSNVRTIMVDTADGVSLSEGPTVTKWKFTTPAFIDSAHFDDINVKEELKNLKAFLDKKNRDASDLTGTEFTNFDVLVYPMQKLKQTIRPEFKSIREGLENRVMEDYKLPIKQILLDKFIRKVKPKLQDKGVKAEEEQGLEGIVLLDPHTQRQIKIVDKDLFTTMNRFNYMIRNDIRGMVRSDDEEASLEQKGGLFGQAKIRIARLFEIDGLANAMKTKRIISKFKGETPEQTVANFGNSLAELDWRAIKTKIDAIIKSTLTDLQESLDNFKENKDSYTIKVGGKQVKYSDEVVRRTLLVFAETRKSLLELKSRISKAQSIEDIIIACFGKQIREIHGEKNDEEY
jgi:hypothetical protein